MNNYIYYYSKKLLDRAIAELIAEICKKVTSLYKASESIALLDMLTSFAHCSRQMNYVRPEFAEDVLAVKSGRHPIKEKISTECFIPNDIYSDSTSNMQIITGPNMSGKSTYLRMIALLNIMAQTGSFIPADYASIRIQSQIFSRIGMDSSIDANASSFMIEMRESAFILQNITHDSLVIVSDYTEDDNLYMFQIIDR